MESFLSSDELFSVEAATLQRKLDSLEATSSNALSFAAFYGMPWRLVFRWRGMPENVELRLDRTAERMQHLLEAGGKIDSLKTLLVLKKAFPAIPLHAATIGSSQIRIFLTAAWEALCHPEGKGKSTRLAPQQQFKLLDLIWTLYAFFTSSSAPNRTIFAIVPSFQAKQWIIQLAMLYDVEVEPILLAVYRFSILALINQLLQRFYLHRDDQSECGKEEEDELVEVLEWLFMQQQQQQQHESEQKKQDNVWRGLCLEFGLNVELDRLLGQSDNDLLHSIILTSQQIPCPNFGYREKRELVDTLSLMLQIPMLESLEKLHRNAWDLDQAALDKQLYSLSKRHNVFDGDEFDVFHGASLGADSVTAAGLRETKTEALELLRDSTQINKAAILAQVQQQQQEEDEWAYDDEYDDTYDNYGALATPTTQENQHEALLITAIMQNPEVFRRSAEVKRSEARKQLREKTGMTDEQLEGWATFFEKKPLSVREELLLRFSSPSNSQPLLPQPTLQQQSQQQSQHQRTSHRPPHNRKRQHAKKHNLILHQPT